MADDVRPMTPPDSTPVETPAEDTSFAAYKASRIPAPEPAPPVVPVEPAPVEAPPPEPKEEPEPDETLEKEPAPGHPDTRTPTQKRIGQAVRRQRDAERREVAAREEAARLKGRLEALEAAVPKPPIQTEATTAKAEAMPDNPADPKPKIEDFDTYEAGAEAVSRWVARQEYHVIRSAEQRVEQQQRQQAEAQTVLNGYNARVAAFKAEHADWDQVVDPNLPVSADIMEPFILRSPSGPAITHYLGQHPDECRALAAMRGPLAFAALGKLEAKLEAPAEVPVPRLVPPAPPPPPISRAPAPITPVRGAPMAASADESEWRSYRTKRLAGKQV